MTGTEIIAKLKELEITPEVWAGEGKWENHDEDNFDEVLKTNFGEWKEVHSERVNEYYEIVYYFSDHDVYIATDGDYSSWDGINYEYSEWSIVKPKEVTIIKYI